MISSRILVTALLAAFAVGAAGQQPQVREVIPVPDDAIYDSFFYRVAWLEKLSNTLISQGKNDTAPRSAIRTQAGLSIPEEAALKAIAADHGEKIAAIARASKALRAAGAQPSNSPQFEDLCKQREQTIADHIGQLREALGPERFRELDAFVRKTSTVRLYEILPPAR